MPGSNYMMIFIGYNGHYIRLGDHKAIRSCCDLTEHDRLQDLNQLHISTDIIMLEEEE